MISTPLEIETLRGQVERMAGMDKYPFTEAAKSELVEALRECRDVFQAATIVTMIVQHDSKCPTPALLRATIKQESSRHLPGPVFEQLASWQQEAPRHSMDGQWASIQAEHLRILHLRQAELKANPKLRIAGPDGYLVRTALRDRLFMLTEQLRWDCGSGNFDKEPGKPARKRLRVNGETGRIEAA